MDAFLEFLLKKKRSQTIPEDELSSLLLGIIRDVAAGMAHMHQHNVIHRDLACRNFLLDRSGRVIVADFGLSRVMDDTHHTCTKGGIFPITLPPEVIQESVFRKSSDIYMFGLCAWHIWTLGEPTARPFHGVTDCEQVSRSIVLGKLVDEMHFKEYRAPPELRSVIVRALNHHSRERPNFAEIASDLSRAQRLNGVPLSEVELLARELNLYCAMRAKPMMEQPVLIPKTAGVDEWSALSSLSEQAHKLSTGPTLGSYSSYTTPVASSVTQH
jgi:serine/threonine protein kinase